MGRKPTQYPTGISVHGSRIVIRFRWNKQRVRRSLSVPVTDKNIERAARIRSEIIVRIRYNNFTPDDLKTYFPEAVEEAQTYPENFFGNYAQRWLDAVEVSANSRDAYKLLLNRYWMPRFAMRPLISITYSELRAAVSGIAWTSNKTRNNALIPLRGIFEMALIDEIIDRDPAAKLRNMKYQKPPSTRSAARKRKPSCSTCTQSTPATRPCTPPTLSSPSSRACARAKCWRCAGATFTPMAPMHASAKHSPRAD